MLQWDKPAFYQVAFGADGPLAGGLVEELLQSGEGRHMRSLHVEGDGA